MEIMKHQFGMRLSLAFFLTLTAIVPTAHAKVVERIVARVNSEIITLRAFDREKAKLREQLSRDYSGSDLDLRVRDGSKDLLRDLIDQSLMVQKAKDLDISVETDIIKRLEEIRKNVNVPTLEDLQREVEKQGLGFEDFKDNIRRSLLMREVIGREVGSRIIISRQDARKYYDENRDKFQSPGGVRLAQILISTEKRKPEEAEKRAKEALKELKAGARFSDVASRFSDDRSSADGGEIGYFKSGTLAPVIASAIEKLDVNESTDLLQTKYGYAIFKVLEKLRPGIPSFEEIEPRVMEILYNQQVQPAMREYLVNLRKESYIFLAPGYVDTGSERTSDALRAEKR